MSTATRSARSRVRPRRRSNSPAWTACRRSSRSTPSRCAEGVAGTIWTARTSWEPSRLPAASRASGAGRPRSSPGIGGGGAAVPADPSVSPAPWGAVVARPSRVPAVEDARLPPGDCPVPCPRESERGHCVPSHDETVPPSAGSVRRSPPARARSTGGGGGTGRGAGGTPPAGRGRTTASRSAGGPAGQGVRAGGDRPPGSRPAGSSGRAPRSPEQTRDRRLKIAIGALAGLVVLFGVFVGVVYASTDVPDPDSVVSAQTTIVYYADGTTEMARLGSEGQNRTNVTLDKVSEPARNAVLAAENRSFYTDPGISFTGILRAAWNNVTGGSTQGGSTITQQYVKNAFLTQDQTFSRKFQELFLAIKLDNNFSKDEILENYLNTIYFGRGAYGIEAAANTYFGIPAAQLTAQQGAVLAVLIRNPSANDPEVDLEGAQARWAKVLDAMVEEKWLSSDERSASAYPPVLPKAGSSLGIPAGPEGLVVPQAIAALESKGYTEQQIRAGGLRITTTVDLKSEEAAKAAVAEVMEGEPDNLRQSLVAVDPRTGAVRAYYGGPG